MIAFRTGAVSPHIKSEEIRKRDRRKEERNRKRNVEPGKEKEKEIRQIGNEKR